MRTNSEDTILSGAGAGGKPTDKRNLDRKRFWLTVRLITYGAMLLLAAVVALPSLLKSRWVSCGMPVLYKVSVADAQTGQPVAGARVLIWFLHEEMWFSDESVDDNAATSDARGTCAVRSHLPGSGSGRKGQLKPNLKIWVEAEGYEPWQNTMAALLGRSVSVADAFQTNSFALKIRLTRK